WWIFAVLGALVSAAWLEPVFGELFGLAAGSEAATGLDPARAKALGWAAWLAALVPGALVGGGVGWVIIGPGEWGPGECFRGFNWVFDRLTEGYGRVVGGLLRLSAVVLLVYGGLLALTYYGCTSLPTGFIPNQDQGYLVVDMQLPDSAALERTVDVVEQVGKIVREEPAVAHTLSVAGEAVAGNPVRSNLPRRVRVLQ